MKQVSLLSAIALAGITSLPAQAENQAPMTYYMESALVEVCKSVKSDRPIRLIKALKGHRLSIPTINEKLMCNGEAPYNFALTHNADRTAKTLNKGRVKIRDIAATGSKYYIYVK